MAKKLPLDNVTVSYDDRNGSIYVQSRDTRLAGKPFQLTVTSNSSSYQSLLNILQDEGLVDLEKMDIPTSLRVEDASSFIVPNADPRGVFQIGIGVGNTPVSIDLTVSPHVLVAGWPGSGKSVILRNCIAHALAHDSIELWGIDLKQVELGSYKYRPQDRLAYTIEDSATLLLELVAKIDERYERMVEAGVNNYKELPDLPAIYLLIDEVGAFIDLYTNMPQIGAEAIPKALEHIAKLGRAAGVHCFVGTQKVDSEIMSPEFNANLTTRILLRDADPRTASLTLGGRPKFGGVFLQNRGRGIISDYGKQTLFQSFFMPGENLK